jgi:hypothetical protein
MQRRRGVFICAGAVPNNNRLPRSFCRPGQLNSTRYGPRHLFRAKSSAPTKLLLHDRSERWSVECEHAEAQLPQVTEVHPRGPRRPDRPPRAIQGFFHPPPRARVISRLISVGFYFGEEDARARAVAGLVAAYLLYVLIASPPPTALGGTARCFSSPDD